MMKHFLVFFGGLVLAGFAAEAGHSQELLMATTTSTQDSGLLDHLQPILKKETGIDLKWTAKGTGQALELAKRCDADVVMVHAPKAEQAFVDEGFGVDRRPFMYNDFVLVGPAADAAKVKGKDVKTALSAIKAAKATFVSRGDDSGTHKLELDLWKKSDIPTPDKESWYVAVGQGMFATLAAAGERLGYTIADRATLAKYESKNPGRLAVLVEGDPGLINQYSVMGVNPTKCPKAKADLAKKFMDWMVSKSTLDAVAAFKIEGKQVFFPNYKK